MFYKGNLSNFYPPDLLIFLSSSEQDGYLTVQKPAPLSITIKNGMVVDAFSTHGDNLLLRILFLKKLITPSQIQLIAKARKETSLSCRQILEKLDFFSIKTIEGELIQSIEEAIFQFFQKESGLFQFTDTTIDDNNCVTKLFPDELLLDITTKVDAWRDHLHHLGDLNQIVTLNPQCHENAASRTEEVFIHMAKKNKTLNQLIHQAPFSNYVATKTLVNCIRQNLFLLEPNSETNSSRPSQASIFTQYKNSLRKTLHAKNLRQKLEEVLHFCKKYFEYTAILSINNELLERAICFRKNDNGTLQSEKSGKQNLSIKEDPLISTVCRQGLAYFGKMQESPFLKELFSTHLDGECGLLPFEIKEQQVKLLFTHTSKDYKGQSPMQYMELLSWLIRPEQVSEELPDDFGQDKIRKILNLSEELPPMPHVASKALEILNNPDNSLQKLSEVLEQDPSLLAIIIKVSNSALYSSGQEITNLQTAVTKLGLTTIRSLVLTAATRTLFPVDNPKIKDLATPLWHHVKGCGLAARIIAKTVGYPDPEEAFVGGLLHDIGKLAILINYPKEYETIRQESFTTPTATYLIEQQRLGFDHTDIGQILTEKWRMPKPLQTCVKYHHVPEEASDTYRQLAMIIHLADLLSHKTADSETDHITTRWHNISFLCAELNLSDEDFATMEKDIHDSAKHIHSLDG